MNDDVSPLAEEANAYYEDLLRPVFAGRKFLMAAQIAAAVGLGGLARRLTRLGAERPFLLAGSEGTGALPAPEEAELRVLGIHSADVLEDFRNLRRALEDLPADVRRDVDAWDPAGTARFIFASPLADSVDVADRKAYAGRRPAWAALEDKVQIDAFWDAVLGCRRCPSRAVPDRVRRLRCAPVGRKRVGPRPRHGLGSRRPRRHARRRHGAALGTTRRRRTTVLRVAAQDGGPDARHAVPGRRASKHPRHRVPERGGRVPACRDGRTPSQDRRPFALCGCATAFDPRPDDRRAMRDLAYRVGAALRETVDYRGPFGIDGILAEDGYLPTELNARAGGAMGRPLAQGNDLPLTPLCLAVTEDERLDYRPNLLERAVVESADAHRTCMGWSVTPLRIEENSMLEVVRDGEEYRECLPGEEPHGTVQAGPGPVGGFVRFVLEPGRIELGRSAAPEVVRAFRFADRALGTDFGEFDVASDVRW